MIVSSSSFEFLLLIELPQESSKRKLRAVFIFFLKFPDQLSPATSRNIIHTLALISKKDTAKLPTEDSSLQQLTKLSMNT